MKANRKADLQRKLTLRVVPTPPAGLAERIKSDIPKHLPTATELDRRRLGSAIAFNMRVAASVLLLVGSLFFALHLLNRAYQEDESKLADFSTALQKNAPPPASVSPAPKPQRSEPQVVTSTDQPPKVVAPPRNAVAQAAPSAPQPQAQYAYEIQEQERLSDVQSKFAQPKDDQLKRGLANGRLQIADADNGPAGERRRERQLLQRDEKDTDSRKKAKEETRRLDGVASANDNEVKSLGYLDKTQRAASAPAPVVAANTPPAALDRSSVQPAPPPPASASAAAAPKPATVPAPIPQTTSGYDYTNTAPRTAAPAEAKMRPAPQPATGTAAPAVAESTVVTAEAPLLAEKITIQKGAKAGSSFVASAQAADLLAIGAPSTVFGYALTGKSLEPASLVQRLTAPPTRPRHGVRVEADAAPAPLDATKKVLRVSIDTAALTGEPGSSPAPLAADAQWEIVFNGDAVMSHRVVTGEPSTREHVLVEGVSVTALYELELKPSLPRSTMVATVRMHYRSLADGHEQPIEREIRVRDMAPSWAAAPARTKRASLAAAFGEAHARGEDTAAIAEKARAMGFAELAGVR